jgi:proline iminopeptidase
MPQRPRAPAAGSVCASSPQGVTTVERPMFPERADSPSFGYSFKVHAGTNPKAPAVIYLPGGPGETSISAKRELEFLPPEYTVIQTDPRGLGCNAPPSVDHYPDEFYSSVNFAGDVLAIVQKLRLENYILYGISYGTLLATVTASKAETEGVTPPKAIVLEGVIGAPFTTQAQVEEVYQSEWRAVRDRLPEAVLAQLIATPAPLGLSADQWGAALTTMLLVGTWDTPESFAESWLLKLLPEATDADRAELRETVLRFAEDPVTAFGWRLHMPVACREIMETGFLALTLKDGELVATSTYCDDEPLDRAYAARDWPVTSPIYYFSGTKDPATPTWQADAHFEAQRTAPRTLVSIPDGGHNPMFFNLSDCLTPLWSAIGSGQGFGAALELCSWPTRIKTAAPGE